MLTSKAHLVLSPKETSFLENVRSLPQDRLNLLMDVIYGFSQNTAEFIRGVFQKGGGLCKN